MNTLQEIADALAGGRTTSVRLVAEAFERIEEPNGEGGRSFIHLFKDAATATAEASDAMRGHGIVPSPLAGIPISVKDLCDVAGYTTLAGSRALEHRPPAAADAAVVARLRAAGAVIVGTTNINEFALGVVGVNPHYGTPRNPWDRATGRIPGGSSAGAAVSVTDGMAAAALGTDTAGSIRVPAGLCGLVGFKPTVGRIPTEGVFPLSFTLDSVGPLARSVACCASLDAVFAGTAPSPLRPAPVAHAKIAVPDSLALDDLDEAVSAAFQSALARLSAAGAQIVEIDFPELNEIAGIHRHGTIPIAEGYALHRELLESRGHLCDAMIAERLRGGAKITAADYIAMLEGRAALSKRADRVTADYDAVAMPTVPIIAPPITDFTEDRDRWMAANALILRNTVVANFLGRCAITLPCQAAGEAPVGLMLMGERMGDRALLRLAAGVEAALG